MTLSLLYANAIRENVIRLSFSEEVYLSFINDQYDATRLGHGHWYILEDASTGIDGLPNRKVSIVSVQYAPINEVGDTYRKFIDLYTDRSLSAFPCTYSIGSKTQVYGVTHSLSGGKIFPDPGSSVALSMVSVFGLKASQEPQQTDQGVGGKDFSFTRKNVDPNAPYDPIAISSFSVSEGDYAIDSGLANLKKRILRRLITVPGSFAHMPTYGIGVPNYVKKLNRADVVTKLETDAQLQIEQEPEVTQASVKVQPVSSGLVRIDIRIKTQDGKKYSMNAPFSAT